MNIKAGTRVLITRDQNRLVLQPVSSFTEKLRGLTARSFGKTPGEINEFIDKERKDR
jgi:bifunctional DNA-binding transcriptional regulator/antitoxin component of YhaV-PrlF toxin-antitoxin module